MRSVFEVARTWWRQSVPFALGTLVDTQESSPAPTGTTVAVNLDGSIAGNIGAGCRESEIVEACLQSIADGKQRVLPIDLSIADEVTGTPGCGGSLQIVVWRPQPGFEELADAVVRGECAVALEFEDRLRCSIQAKPRLYVTGATTLAQELARTARGLEYYVTVVDPRPAFATAQRIPDADELVLRWPDEYLPQVLDDRSALVAVSHDPKFDVPAIACALRAGAAYIGLLGSRRTQAARRDALRELGFGEPELARIHGPVGLALGAESAAEIALSVLAEMLAVRNARSADSLATSSGAIHA